MLKIICSICDIELKDFGALLFSPPKESEVKKFHICKECYNELFKNIVD